MIHNIEAIDPQMHVTARLGFLDADEKNITWGDWLELRLLIRTDEHDSVSIIPMSLDGRPWNREFHGEIGNDIPQDIFAEAETGAMLQIKDLTQRALIKDLYDADNLDEVLDSGGLKVVDLSDAALILYFARKVGGKALVDNLEFRAELIRRGYLRA